MVEKYYGISSNEYRARLSLNKEYKNKEVSILKYWMKELNLTSDQFTKTSFIEAKHKRVYKDKEYKGTLRIKIPNPIRIHHRILSSIDRLSSKLTQNKTHQRLS